MCFSLSILVRFCLMINVRANFSAFFFNTPPSTEFYTLSLHDALPICLLRWRRPICLRSPDLGPFRTAEAYWRSEEHTSELQSRQYLVCRLLLEKKKYRRRVALFRLRLLFRGG